MLLACAALRFKGAVVELEPRCWFEALDPEARPVVLLAPDRGLPPFFASD